MKLLLKSSSHLLMNRMTSTNKIAWVESPKEQVNMLTNQLMCSQASTYVQELKPFAQKVEPRQVLYIHHCARCNADVIKGLDRKYKKKNRWISGDEAYGGCAGMLVEPHHWCSPEWPGMRVQMPWQPTTHINLRTSKIPNYLPWVMVSCQHNLL